jgi:hypothetical protein
MQELRSSLICGVSTRVTIAEFEQLSEWARAKGLSLASFVREILRRELGWS